MDFFSKVRGLFSDVYVGGGGQVVSFLCTRYVKGSPVDFSGVFYRDFESRDTCLFFRQSY